MRDRISTPSKALSRQEAEKPRVEPTNDVIGQASGKSEWEGKTVEGKHGLGEDQLDQAVQVLFIDEDWMRPWAGWLRWAGAE